MYQTLHENDEVDSYHEEVVQKRRPFPLILLSFGILSLVIGTLAPTRLDRAVESAVFEQLRYDNDKAKSYSSFVGSQQVDKENEDSILLRFKLYDIINPELNIHHYPHKKYKVIEKGPYNYRLSVKHINISFFGEETGDFERSGIKEIYFKAWQQVQIILDGPDAGRDDSELITTISIPNQVILSIANKFPSSIKHFIEEYFLGPREKRSYFVTKTVREHLFGYHETFQNNENNNEFLPPQDVIEMITNTIKNYENRLGTFTFKKNKIGLDYPGFVRNYSSAKEVDKMLEFDGQRVDEKMMHTFVWWQGSSQLRKCIQNCPPLWGSREANRVLGSDGKFWGGKKHTENVVFLPELVRSAKVVNNNGEEVFVDGIKCKRWRLDSSVFQNSTSYPPNIAYYATNQPDGIFNLNPVLMDIPVFASKPRYLDADPSLRGHVEGMEEPIKDEHDILFDVHEETGISVMVSERFQYLVKLNEGIYIPMFWFETIERMSNKHEGLFRRCDRYVDAAFYLKKICISIGILLLVIAIYAGTNRAEEDARHSQEVAKHREAYFRLQAGEINEDEIEQGEKKDLSGLALLLSSESLRNGCITTPIFVFFSNLVIELITLKKAKEVGVWKTEPGVPTAIFTELLITAFAVGNFLTMSGVAVARAAYIRGEVPRRASKFEPFRRHNCLFLPWLFFDDASRLGFLVGVYFVIIWACPIVLLLYLFLCGSSFSENECYINWALFSIGKSLFAAIEGSIVFPLSALKALDSSP